MQVAKGRPNSEQHYSLCFSVFLSFNKAVSNSKNQSSRWNNQYSTLISILIINKFGERKITDIQPHCLLIYKPLFLAHPSCHPPSPSTWEMLSFFFSRKIESHLNSGTSCLNPPNMWNYKYLQLYIALHSLLVRSLRFFSLNSKEIIWSSFYCAGGLNTGSHSW